MGHEIPAGLGHRLAHSDAPGDVFVLIGDGTYYMQPTELVTAVQENKNIIVVVIYNRGNQCIWPLQVAKGGPGAEFGTQLRESNPETGRLDGPVVQVDLAANAASMGCAAWTANTLDEFKVALGEARSADRPAVIVALVEPWRYLSGTGAFWDVGVPMTSQRPGNQAGTAEHLKGRERQRFYGATTPPAR